MIYHIQGGHADHYTTDEPMIYHIQGGDADHYTTIAVTYYEITMMSSVYWTNTLSWIFIVLASWNNSVCVDMLLNLVYEYIAFY